MAVAACVPKPTPPVGEPTPPEKPPVQQPPVQQPPAQPKPHNAVLAGVRAGPAIESLGITPASASAALRAFRISCPSVQRRTDASGLTRGSDWATPCAAAPTWPESNALGFFTTHFETAAVTGDAHATGYYEPEIRGSRTRQPGYETPIYRTPPDLLTTNPLTGERGRGRLNERGEYVLYYERSEIEDGALANKGLEIGWAADPIELFFLHIQGSGRLILPDGNVMRIGYDNQNGREYLAIGRIMRDRGILQTGGTSMQHIVAWLRANPEEGRAIMRENKSYIFFKELTGPGPLGALGLPVTPRATVAADPMFVPLGAPVFLQIDRPEANGLWVAQDTGGAIKGANRFDTFWGAGAEAERIAGGMSGRGTAYVLVPKGIVARVLANAPPPQP
ncbi:MAG TPA: murein transglycosylase A [Allosphingosinicella sp.]|uniref:murein transglycosylase A n=1 Tax=Allosphingosinicella sp. TaxID=2823234 RepID=UPI002ED834FB